ncbi:MAG: hypothetical protein IPJ06_05760 [Saprospiraceae bacterium]|nr:hypothetical protein [Saprospiraceae bacterium]
MKTCYSVFFSFFLVFSLFGQDGSLDSTFAENGILQFDLNKRPILAMASAVQPDGRILVSMSGNLTGTFDLVLIRLHEDGSPGHDIR